MSFDHAAAATQLAGNIGYVGQPCTGAGKSGEFRAIFPEESSETQLGDFGTDENVSFDISVSLADFPQAPPFGSIITRVSDARRYRVRTSHRDAAGWKVTVHSLDQSTAPAVNDYPL